MRPADYLLTLIIATCSFLKLHSHIHPRSITEFSYRYNSADVAHIYLSFLLSGAPLPASSTAPSTNGTSATNGTTPRANNSTPDPNALSAGRAAQAAASASSTDPREAELACILAALEADGMPVHDISGNEMAKSHARYLVGGRKNVENERLFRFGEFSSAADDVFNTSYRG